jgi:uncharacterized membrane protein YdjX (TVP38/TMEM64 family)
MKLSDTLKRHRTAAVVVLLLTISGLWLFHSHGDRFSREAVLAYGRSLSGVWFVTAFLLLPLVGMPISILLFLAGIRFGLWGGMALAACGVCFHHLVAYHLVHHRFRDRIRGRLKHRLQRSGYKLPAIHDRNQVWFTVLFAAIHGPPYAFKLYLLAFTEIPFRIYFWAGMPVYVLFCLVPVGAGSAVMEVNTTMIYGIVIGITVLALSGKWLEMRFKRR